MQKNHVKKKMEAQSWFDPPTDEAEGDFSVCQILNLDPLVLHGLKRFCLDSIVQVFSRLHVKSNATTFTISVNRMRGKYDPNLSFTVPPST